MSEKREDTSLKRRNKPISQDEPLEVEIKATERLIEFLFSKNAYEDEASINHRFEVIKEIEAFANDFVREQYMKLPNHDEEKKDEIFAKVCHYGSLFLGVTNPTSDIDILVICPKFVKSTEFFRLFKRYFVDNPKVKNFNDISSSKHPILNFIYDGVELDISYAYLDLPSIPQDIVLTDDQYLSLTDNSCVMPLNGPRVNMLLLQLVDNLESFRTLLRFIRIWAKSRALYGNRYGYLGGVNLAILCAFICQRYPKATPATLIDLFFNDLAKWEWPEPIYINYPNKGDRPSWDHSKISEEVMPIITPAYPCMNSLLSATQGTKFRMIEEFRRGEELAFKCLMEGLDWEKVVEPDNFFTKYKLYYQIDCFANTQSGLRTWSGFIDARLRKFCQSLEEDPSNGIEYAFPYPKFFLKDEKEIAPGQKFSGSFFIAFQYNSKTILLDEGLRVFLRDVGQYRDQHRCPDFEIVRTSLKKKQLPDFVFPNGKPQKLHSHHKKFPSKAKSGDSS